VAVNPTPAIPVVTSSFPVCVGSSLSLSTTTVPSGIYSWKGPNNFSSAVQNPVVANITLNSAGVYTVTVTVNGCTSLEGSKNVFPVIAAPTAGSNTPVCAGNPISLTAGNLTGATYQWTGPGGFNSASQNPTIGTASPAIAGTYYLTASIAGCPGLTDSVKVIVNTPPVTPQITTNAPVCARDSVTLTASNVPGASYQWTGPNGFSSTVQNPVIKKANPVNSGTYTVIVSTVGCTVTSNAALPVTVKAIPTVPIPGNSGPVCVGSSLNLFASNINGATYHWSSASGFNSNLQNPVIPSAITGNSETYYVVADLNGCVGDTAITKVTVVTPAVVNAGTDQTVCANNATIQLNGSITGEDTRSAAWKTTGTGAFFPNDTTLNARYIPGSSDTAKGAVSLMLASAKNKVCAVSSSSISINIMHAPRSFAGPDQSVCSNDSLISLSGLVENAGGGQWYSLGTGSFRRSGTGDLKPVFVPSRQDIQAGRVQFYLITTNIGNCAAVYDTIQASIVPAPKVDAGVDKIIFLNDRYTLTPVVTGTNLRFEWTPTTDMLDNRVKNAVITGKNNITYRLTVTGDGSCIAYDEIFIKVLKPISIPNIFSPNGDGIHDTWELPELINYQNATVEIYTRGGMKIFSSVGYAKPWDGTYNGGPVPVATYYYIVNTRYNNQVFSGSVTVIR
jgi:gliding motility-associated-like protein